MERENMFMNEGNTMPYGMGRQNELNGTSEQLQNCFFNPNWDHSMDQNDPFESALSSMVSSPATSNAAAAPGSAASENFVLRELIGRLGSICNSAEVSPHSYMNGNNSTNTSCYTTPLNSPPKLNLSMMDHQIRGNLPFPGNHFPAHPSLPPLSADSAFAERTARFSSFANKDLGGLNGHFGLNDSELPHRLAPKLDSGKLSRISSNQSLKVSGSQMNVQENKDGFIQDGNSAAEQKFSRLSRSSTPENAEFGGSRENSSVSEQIPGGEIGLNGQNGINSRKRKSISKGKGKDVPSSTSAKDANAAAEKNESSAKRSKSDEDNATDKVATSKAEQNGSENAAGNGNKKENKDNQKPLEPEKDYIHVRARRGQATDAHSLAERVRREKISQRMQFLQDLVPGCNKVTGKAVMLDEIINYVQSLQRQVEFLSMKLATINPRMDVNIEALLSKDMFQSRGSLPHSSYASDSSALAFPFSFQSQQAPNLHSAIPDGTKVPLSMNHVSAAMDRNPSMQHPPLNGYSEAGAQASTFWEDDLQSVVFGQNQAQNFHGVISTAQMKVEL